MKRTIVRPAFGAAAALTLLLTGCGEAASGSGSGAASSSSASTTIDNALGAKFSGGTAGKAAGGSATPITVGMINQEGGQVSDPEGSVAVKAAFDYINAQQGGIGGHPLKLDLCKVAGSEEEAQQCAQKFLNDSAVQVVMQGGLNVGADAVHTTLAGAKPDVVIQANPGADATAANTFAVNPSVLAALPGIANYAKSKSYKTVAIVVDDNPGDLAITQVAQGLFQGAGITTKVTTFPAGSTDLTSAYTAAAAGKPDAITPLVVTTSGCIASAKALQSIGSSIPVVGSTLCATEDIAKGLGDFPKWAYESPILSLFAKDDTGQVAFYKAVMAKYAGSNPTLGINAPFSFGAAFLLADVLNKIGPDAITPAAISAGLKAYTGGVLLYTLKVAFGSVPTMPALSGVADRIYTYEGNGNWSATGWQSLPQ